MAINWLLQNPLAILEVVIETTVAETVEGIKEETAAVAYVSIAGKYVVNLLETVQDPQKEERKVLEAVAQEGMAEILEHAIIVRKYAVFWL